MAIPFKSLRYPARANDVPHTWGFQIARQIRGKDETVVWSAVSRDIAGFLPQMGVLDGMTGLSTSRNLEVQPVFTAFRLGTLDEELGQVVDADPRPELGANFKYGVTSNLIADFTVNPDFSQIESDRPHVEVNQRFALVYPELRPFFLEGAEIFQVQAPLRVVHTRTIVDPLYRAKLTGKAGNVTLGVLYANDRRPNWTPTTRWLPALISRPRRSSDGYATTYIRNRSSGRSSPTGRSLTALAHSPGSTAISGWATPTRSRSARSARIIALRRTGCRPTGI